MFHISGLAEDSEGVLVSVGIGLYLSALAAGAGFVGAMTSRTHDRI